MASDDLSCLPTPLFVSMALKRGPVKKKVESHQEKEQAVNRAVETSLVSCGNTQCKRQSHTKEQIAQDRRGSCNHCPYPAERLGTAI